MRPIPGQVGLCGDFNGQPHALLKAGKALHAQFGHGVPRNELLFRYPIPLHMPEKAPHAKRCSPETLQRAMHICQAEAANAAGWAVAECWGDVCDTKDPLPTGVRAVPVATPGAAAVHLTGKCPESPSSCPPGHFRCTVGPAVNGCFPSADPSATNGACAQFAVVPCAAPPGHPLFSLLLQNKEQTSEMRPWSRWFSSQAAALRMPLAALGLSAGSVALFVGISRRIFSRSQFGL
eukprot:TRINITY_DN3343_c1_g1_i2.p1 TRINITY_DN3343_c1_g1~~TRINITY_DN3343_c1_g1_i2.p1  ORF type:complete len:235 (+),score=28.39 TRINITY_DN3343_c1_g1_i2:49-753(+)